MDTNTWLWLEYRRLQAMLNRTTDAQRAEGIESAMTTVLEKIKGSLSCSSQQIKNLVGNRISKERRRRAVAYRSREEIVPQLASSGAADSCLILQRCAEICGLRDFTLLVRNAQGYTFGELAAVSGVAQNTLKIRAHRARRNLLSLLGRPI
jgi:hypothetical protein